MPWAPLIAFSLLAIAAGCAQRPPTGRGDARRDGGQPVAPAKAGTLAGPSAPEPVPPAPPVTLTWRRAGLAEVAGDLRERFGLDVVWTAQIDGATSVTLEAQVATRDEAVRAVADAASLTCDLCDDTVLFWSECNAEVRERLRDTLITFEFVDKELEEALWELGALGEVRIHTDPALRGTRRTPITLKVNDMRLHLALNWTLRLAGLEYEVREGIVVVGKEGSVDSVAVPPEIAPHPPWPATEADLGQALADAEAALAGGSKSERMRAVFALRRTGDARAPGILQPALSDPDMAVRAEALMAIAQLRGEKALSLVESFLNDQELRWAAVRALGKAGGEDAIALIVAVRNDPDSWIRTCADWALIDIGTGDALIHFTANVAELVGPDDADASFYPFKDRRTAAAVLALLEILEAEDLDSHVQRGGGAHDAHPARVQALRRLGAYRGSSIRDALTARAVVEPSDALRGRIVALLEGSYPQDGVVLQAFARANSREAEEERMRRRARIEAKRDKHLQTPGGVPPIVPVLPARHRRGAEVF